MESLGLHILENIKRMLFTYKKVCIDTIPTFDLIKFSGQWSNRHGSNFTSRPPYLILLTIRILDSYP
jgi:hypothetical protein